MRGLGQAEPSDFAHPQGRVLVNRDAAIGSTVLAAGVERVNFKDEADCLRRSRRVEAKGRGRHAAAEMIAFELHRAFHPATQDG